MERTNHVLAMFDRDDEVTDPMIRVLPRLEPQEPARYVVYELRAATTELRLVGPSFAAAGGVLQARVGATEAWFEHGLAPLSYQLMRALCASAVDEARSPCATRGCVSTRELAATLAFHSSYANEENVRQAVRRTRHLLDGLGASGVIVVQPGRGYFLACMVRLVGEQTAAARHVRNA
jgi:hypothetical protein